MKDSSLYDSPISSSPVRNSSLYRSPLCPAICTPLWLQLNVNLDGSLSGRKHSAVVRLTMARPFSGYFIVPSSHMRFSYFFSDYREFMERMKSLFSPDGLLFTSRDRAEPEGRVMVPLEDRRSVLRLSLSVSENKEWQGMLSCPYQNTEFSFRSRARFEQLLRERLI